MANFTDQITTQRETLPFQLVADLIFPLTALGAIFVDRVNVWMSHEWPDSSNDKAFRIAAGCFAVWLVSLFCRVVDIGFQKEYVLLRCNAPSDLEQISLLACEFIVVFALSKIMLAVRSALRKEYQVLWLFDIMCIATSFRYFKHGDLWSVIVLNSMGLFLELCRVIYPRSTLLMFSSNIYQGIQSMNYIKNVVYGCDTYPLPMYILGTIHRPQMFLFGSVLYLFYVFFFHVLQNTLSSFTMFLLLSCIVFLISQKRPGRLLNQVYNLRPRYRHPLNQSQEGEGEEEDDDDSVNDPNYEDDSTSSSSEEEEAEVIDEDDSIATLLFDQSQTLQTLVPQIVQARDRWQKLAMHVISGQARGHAHAYWRSFVKMWKANKELIKSVNKIITPSSANVSLERRFNCVICLEQERCITLIPCGHLCLCSSCSKALCEDQSRGRGYSWLCPVCRSHVDKTQFTIF